ncbi:Cholesterol 7-alpha-monooxygenase 2 [Colletotrichum kahawae]|uniref:Cholesterol 7-alpha-monooxygenase 2 n=1 Tax=Colletotrichum kahawae TaxID=34407 RepID=A0AAD9Y2K6_COLKA|nr:Cholesterol 7-alpha-monooxygenase 2 [Colletotrichum kahawae]
MAVAAAAAALLVAFWFQQSLSTTKQPPRLKETVPFVSNTYQYLSNAGAFIDRVTYVETNSNILKFYVGFTPAYIVVGAKNVQKILNSPTTLDGHFLQLLLMKNHWGWNKEEIAKFANDHSGRAKVPAVEGVSDEERYWFGHNQLYVDFLSHRAHADSMAQNFFRFLLERLDHGQNGSWSTVRLMEVLKSTMGEAAIMSLYGTKIIETNPGFVQAYWDFDEVGGHLVWGLPHFLQRKSVAIKDELHAMTRRHLDSAWEQFEWDGPDAESMWEPHFGSRLARETCRWLRDRGFSDHAQAGHTMALLFGLNGNTVPVTMWVLIELLRDPALYAAVQAECLPLLSVDPATGERRIDGQRLASQPLMQSLYVEIMRLHVTFNVSRTATQPVQVEDYVIPAGALVQTCSQIAHYDEEAWGCDGHPASKFWAYRNVKYVDGQPTFAMRGRPSAFFPYGGGYIVCPGRFFAKQEILLAVAAFVTKFDIEFVGWLNLDGSQSDRAPENDKRYAAFIAMHPDRDVAIRWKKRWE